MRRHSTISSAFVGALLFTVAPVVAQAAGGQLTPRELYKSAGKGVVLVFATDGSANGSAGTGSIITDDGQVITNAHVVAKDGRNYKKLFVYLKPDKLRGSMKDDLKHRYEAKLVDIDHKLDLALLKMKKAPSDLTVIPFANPDDVEIGDPVVAIGHPETAGLWTLTTGVVSSVVADFQGVAGKDVFQTEASINRGNSGGPLLNAYGHMVGINTSISRRAKDGLAITDINFSLKSSVPVTWMKRHDLMHLAYAKPRSIPDSAVAMADDSDTEARSAVKKPTVRDEPKTPSKPDEELVVKTDSGKIKVMVHEPEDDEEVADDPEWEASTGDEVEVSGSRRVQAQQKKAQQARKKQKLARAKKKEAKILTRRRPYQMDPFVRARVKEIKALEDMMDEMSGEIDRRRGKKSKRSTGLGLW